MNRAQQAKFAEDGKFADFDNLGLGVKTQTSNYTYAVSPPAPTAATTTVGNVATPLSTALKAYTGTVELGKNATTSETTTVALLCEAKASGTATVPLAAGAGGDFKCQGNSVEVSK
jgi:hypothetical protein